ncbi:MAG: alanine racemase [Pseudomonadota bacterium]
MTAPRDPYFLNLQAALQAAGAVGPILVIDKARLNANIDAVVNHLPAGMDLRVVAKSLPSRDLLSHILARAGTNRFMTFNLPMLLGVSEAFPDASQLLGKPLVAAAAKAYYDRLPVSARAAAEHVTWLVDTPDRLAQYAAIAEAAGVQMAVCVEVDVGLNRGGFHPGDAFRGALETIRASNRLTLAGMMGYDAHLTARLNDQVALDRGLADVQSAYAAALADIDAVFGEGAAAGLLRNTGGSPTFHLHTDISLANEICVGSALVMPSGFDTPGLAAHQPAAFIAAPVLKTVSIPSASGAEPGVYIHGGRWMADVVDPPGLTPHRGARSSNQELIMGACDLAPDDFLFLRPRQSEAVFLQFGDIAVYDTKEITDWWPVFPASA